MYSDGGLDAVQSGNKSRITLLAIRLKAAVQQ